MQRGRRNPGGSGGQQGWLAGTLVLSGSDTRRTSPTRCPPRPFPSRGTRSVLDYLWTRRTRAAMCKAVTCRVAQVTSGLRSRLHQKSCEGLARQSTQAAPGQDRCGHEEAGVSYTDSRLPAGHHVPTPADRSPLPLLGPDDGYYRCGGSDPVRAQPSARKHKHRDRHGDHDYVPLLRAVCPASIGGIHTLRYGHVLLLLGSPSGSALDAGWLASRIPASGAAFLVGPYPHMPSSGREATYGAMHEGAHGGFVSPNGHDPAPVGRHDGLRQMRAR